MNYIEIGATVTGLLQAILIMVNSRYNWVAYIIQMILMIVFSITVSLYGDAVNSGVYLILGIIGFTVWNLKKGEKPIRKCSAKERLCYLAITVVGVIVFYGFLTRTDDVLPFIDSVTSATSFVATYYMITKKIDTWIIWFFNDILYVIQYALIPDVPVYLLTLNVIWTVLAVFAYLNWSRIMKKQQLGAT